MLLWGNECRLVQVYVLMVHKDGTMGTKKIKATEATCDGCGGSQVVADPIDIVGFFGAVSEQGPWGGTGRVKFFSCSTECLEKAISNAIQKANDE